MSSRWTTICRTRRRRSSGCSPSPSRAASEVVYTYYDEKQHAAWRNLGSRFTNWVAGFVLDKPKGFYLSSFRCMSAFVVREITRYEGPFPYVDGLILQVTQDIDRLLVRHLPRAVGPQQLHAAPAVAAVAEHVRQFLGHAAAAQHVDRRSRSACSARSAASMAIVEALFVAPPPGWASLIAAVLLLSGVQLLILGIVGEYLGRLYLTANGKPQSVVQVGDRARPTAVAEAAAVCASRSVREPAREAPDRWRSTI